MINAESVQQFYDRTKLPQPGIFTKQHGHFNVYDRGNFCVGSTPYQRKNFYKISLIIGKYFEENAAAVDVTLTADELHEIEALLLKYPNTG